MWVESRQIGTMSNPTHIIDFASISLCVAVKLPKKKIFRKEAQLESFWNKRSEGEGESEREYHKIIIADMLAPYAKHEISFFVFHWAKIFVKIEVKT